MAGQMVDGSEGTSEGQRAICESARQIARGQLASSPELLDDSDFDDTTGVCDVVNLRNRAVLQQAAGDDEENTPVEPIIEREKRRQKSRPG